jgi:hypothetical protein
MSILDQWRNKFWSWLLPEDFMDTLKQERFAKYNRHYSYYIGEQLRYIKVKPEQPDDNIISNFAGLTVDRSVSMLVGGGIEFDMPGDEGAPQQEYINEVWEANKLQILTHKAAQHAGIAGTGYIKIIPDGVESKQRDDKLLPRLVALDPRYMEIVTDPEDIETVNEYIIRFMVKGADGKERIRKETIRREFSEMNDAGMFETVGWIVINEISDGGKWEETDRDVWPYEFPPIVHWQNLPEPGNVYGQSDIDDVVELQDRFNFVVSNINRIIRYHAHPKSIGTGFRLGDLDKSEAVDDFWSIPNENAKVFNLEMLSDLVSSRAFANDLRQAIFDISRTVDIASFGDKLGALTNFGLRVLFFDALAKLATKRVLFGEALTELNHRMLVMAQITPNDGGRIVWPEVLPSSEQEDVMGLKFDMEAGLLSKQTASKIRGYDWDVERERLEDEQAQGDNIGALLLRNFERGGE